MGFTRVILGEEVVLFDRLSEKNSKVTCVRELADYKRKILKRLGRLLVSNDRSTATEQDIRCVFNKELYDEERLCQKAWVVDGVEYESFTAACEFYNSPCYYTTPEKFSNMVRKRLGKLKEDALPELVLACYNKPPRVIKVPE